VLAVALVAGCGPPPPPPRWAEGGAILAIPKAVWVQSDGDKVELLPDGRVLDDGDLLFVVDRVGRVVDSDYEPFALLFPDGRLAGSGGLPLGHVGMTNAAPPDRHEAWLAVMPDGNVVYFDEDGARAQGGRWSGCEGPAHRTCTLVTHLVAVQHYVHQSSGPDVGVGIGVGF